MGLLDKIKKSAQSASASKADIFWTRNGDKKRIRMLCEVDDGSEIVFHYNYAKKINVPCQTQFARSCPYCDEPVDGVREVVKYIFPIYSQADGVQQIMIEKAWKESSPIMPLLREYELQEKDTFMDCDYLIAHEGVGKEKSIAVRAMNPCKLEQKITPWTKAEMMEKIDKAYPYRIDLDIEVDDGDLPF